MFYNDKMFIKERVSEKLVSLTILANPDRA